MATVNLTNISWLTAASKKLTPGAAGNFAYNCTLNTESGAMVFIVLFPAIFLFSIAGNGLVILTVVRNKSMHTVTNLFLINLAVSDLLLTVICMPPTYTGYLYSCFFYGRFMCTLIYYMQPLSVAACSNTLVAIALERYQAICKPLQSQHWKTKSHALVVIACAWVVSGLCTVPSAIHVELVDYDSGRLNCRDTFSNSGRKIYYAFITMACFGVPLVVMVILYGMVIHTLRQGIQMESHHDRNFSGVKLEKNASDRQPKKSVHHLRSSSLVHSVRLGITRRPHKKSVISLNTVNLPNRSGSAIVDDKTDRLSAPRNGWRQQEKYTSPVTVDSSYASSLSVVPRETMILRSTHQERNLTAKKRVIRMLIMIVIEFFTCWTPLYVYVVLISMGKRSVHLLHLFFLALAYTSVLTNPVTYCFVNANFRDAMLKAVGLHVWTKHYRSRALKTANNIQDSQIDQASLWNKRSQAGVGAGVTTPSTLNTCMSYKRAIADQQVRSSPSPPPLNADAATKTIASRRMQNTETSPPHKCTVGNVMHRCSTVNSIHLTSTSLATKYAPSHSPSRRRRMSTGCEDGEILMQQRMVSTSENRMMGCFNYDYLISDSRSDVREAMI